MEKDKFLFSDIFWVLVAILGIFAANLFEDSDYKKYFQYFCGAVIVVFWAIGLYVAFFGKHDD